MTGFLADLDAALARASLPPMAAIRRPITNADRALELERHELMLAALDESWWHVRRRWRRLARLEAVELELGLRRPDW